MSSENTHVRMRLIERVGHGAGLLNDSLVKRGEKEPEEETSRLKRHWKFSQQVWQQFAY